MTEIVVKIPTEVSEELLAKLKEDIGAAVRLRIARELLLKGWNKRFANSTLTEEECQKLGEEVNKATLELWKDKGWA